MAQLVENLPAVQETLVGSLSWEVPLEKGQATHSSILGLPWGSDGKESSRNARDLGSIPVLGRSPGGGNGNPLQCSCLRIPQKEKPGSYGPWGHEELDTTERLTLMSFRQDNNKKWLK